MRFPKAGSNIQRSCLKFVKTSKYCLPCKTHRFDDLLDEELDDEDMEISPPQLPVPHVDEAGKWFHSQLMDQITKERGRHLVDTPGVLPAADLTNYLSPEGLKALRATDTYVTRLRFAI